MIGVDPLGAALRELSTDETGTHGSSSTTNAVPAFDHVHINTRVEQQPGASQTCESGTDDNDTHGYA